MTTSTHYDYHSKRQSYFQRLHHYSDPDNCHENTHEFPQVRVGLQINVIHSHSKNMLAAKDSKLFFFQVNF